MDARFYNSEEIDIERLASDLVNIFMAQNYQAQQFATSDQALVQLKKGGDFEAIIGMQAAVSLTIQRTAGGILAMIGQQRWLDKAAVGTVGLIGFPILWPLALTAGAGVLRQASLGNQVLNVVDGLVRQQRPGIQIGPVPVQLMPQIQQWASRPPTPVYTPPAPTYVPPAPQQVVIAQPAPQQALPAPPTLRCPDCNTPYEEGDTFCSGCGRSLIPSKTYCSNCHAELKLGASFCPNCGASAFQGGPATQAAPSQSAPQAPVYTPPAAPPAQPRPETYYVPPTTQNPPVMPQPKVTITSNAPKEAPPAKPQRPQTPYYTPPAPVQPPVQATQSTSAGAIPPTPIEARPASTSAPNASATWGTLIFSDGRQVQLKGERALVGRYDHDLGGNNPEVDLNGVPGADTTSRIHAVLEHVGSTYTLTDLNSTNSTRINGKRLEPDKATPINDGDTLYFGKVTCTFKKA